MNYSLAIVVALSLFAGSAMAGSSSWSGAWQYTSSEGSDGNADVSFRVNLKENVDNTILGSYCLITQDGKRTDCDTTGESNLRGEVFPAKNIADIAFYSFFDKKPLRATARLSGDSLIWKVVSNTSESAYNGPTKVVLKRVTSDSRKRIIGSGPVDVRKEPSDQSPIVETLHANDVVVLKNISQNLQFWAIDFPPGAGGEQRHGWVRCEALSLCAQ